MRSARISFFVICLYVLVFLLDSVTFPVFRTVEDKKVYVTSKTLLDIMYQPAREESYSAPLAKFQLGDRESRNKGFHPLGTNINGEDVFRNGLKGIKVAFTMSVRRP